MTVAAIGPDGTITSGIDMQTYVDLCIEAIESK